MTPYTHAAALARRLSAEKEHGAVLLLDGWQAIAGFRFFDDLEWIDIQYAQTACTFYSPRETMTAEVFSEYWRGRIKVLRESAWPEGDEPLTTEQAANCAMDLQGVVDLWLTGEAKAAAVVESADRLARVCREIRERKGDQG